MSVVQSVGWSVRPQPVLRIKYAQFEASSSHSSFNRSSNSSSSSSRSLVQKLLLVVLFSAISYSTIAITA